jgi:hypothetical protein
VDEADRRAAVAVRTLERPDVRSLRSRLEKLAAQTDDLVQAQDSEIRRLRLMVLKMADGYRMALAGDWKRKGANAAFFRAVDALALEADAIRVNGDMFAPSRTARRRVHGRTPVLGGDEGREGEVDEGVRPEE